jgi:hypothetical protein
MASRSRWHEAARAAIRQMLPGLTGTAADASGSPFGGTDNGR